ncbi:MAG: 3-deoxy-D-manno-octulosonic acid transferase [Fimbriimonadaceae bacterium]
MFWVYNILLTFLSPIWVPWMLWRANKRAEKVDWQERQGNYKLDLREGSDRIWFHAVSVGEVVASLPILREIRRLAPEAEIVLSVTTSSGNETALKQAEGLFDHLVYFPIDVVRFTLAAMSRVEPKAVAVMETELWMNFFWAAKTVQARTLVLNGRVSDRSFPRSSKLGFFYRPLLAQVDEVLVQTDTDQERFVTLGARSAEVLGNCKFDQALEGLDADATHWRSELGIPADAQVVVIGSTRGEMEEAFVVNALNDERLKDAWVVHAPRHMETVASLAARVSAAFGSVALRSKGESGRYLILDSYGELSQVYSVADVVVIGGGFDKLGGQNLIQPLAHGKPVVHGPHMMNFRDVTDMADRVGATLVVDSPEALRGALLELLEDAGKRARMGKAAADLVAENRGASTRYAERVVAAMQAAPGVRRGKK